MDFTAITSDHYGLLAALLVGILVGKALGMEQRVLSGYIVIAILSPAAFSVVALGYVILCVIAKGLAQWVSWL